MIICFKFVPLPSPTSFHLFTSCFSSLGALVTGQPALLTFSFPPPPPVSGEPLRAAIFGFPDCRCLRATEWVFTIECVDWTCVFCLQKCSASRWGLDIPVLCCLPEPPAGVRVRCRHQVLKVLEGLVLSLSLAVGPGEAVFQSLGALAWPFMSEVSLTLLQKGLLVGRKPGSCKSWGS